MPSITNLVVKKNDNTTDVTYTGVVPSSGDRSPAIWQNQAVGSAHSHRPYLKVTAKTNGSGSARWLNIEYVYPQLATNSTTGLTSVVNKAMHIGNWSVPTDMPVSDANEAISQFAHLMAHADIKTALRSLYAPT